MSWCARTCRARQQSENARPCHRHISRRPVTHRCGFQLFNVFFCWRFQRFPTVCPRARNSERGLQAGQVNNTKIPKFKYLWWGTHMSSKFAREIKRLKNIFYKTSQNIFHPYCVITYVYEQFIQNHGTHHGNARLIRDDQQWRVFFHHCGDGLQFFLSEDLPQRCGGGVEHQNPAARAG